MLCSSTATMAAVAVAAALGTGWHHRRFLELFRHLPHYVALGFSVPLLLLLNLPSYSNCLHIYKIA